jgi:hypothetical protein
MTWAVFIKLWSVGHRWSAAVLQVIRCDLGINIFEKIASDTERMKNTPTHICAKIAYPKLTKHWLWYHFEEKHMY